MDEKLPCRREAPDLWFSDAPAELERARILCRPCPILRACLEGALRRGEPWGVWGGEILERGAVIARRRRRGRPSNVDRLRDDRLRDGADVIAGTGHPPVDVRRSTVPSNRHGERHP
ncbi:WhiB family transcriptional regulator [Geodermatophilus africanus]|uniref:WhiB family transcriptional regulator n=1 Tax=Geodermatophilus africanus TaxID=1137993 RepID=UPI000B86A33E|nr:WhiB family transcriptional regulator [Geodermatophilus africanus]